MEIHTKLHYCTDIPIQYRYRKIKSVITALGIDVIDVPRQTFADLRELSPIPTLPLLQTKQGNFTSSNTIIRYLAAKAGYKLYGGDNIFQRALIDQWLDITQNQFDTCAIALNVYLDGKDVDIQTVTHDAQKFLTYLNKYLKNRKYLVDDQLSIADLAVAATISPVLTNMYGEQERKKYGIITNWFHHISEISKQIQPKQLPKKIHKKFEKKKQKNEKNEQVKDAKQEKGKNKQKGKGKDETKQKQTNQGKQKKGKNKKQKQQKQKQPKVDAEKKAAVKDDLFADDDQPEQKVEKVEKKVDPKPAKKKPAAKSIVVFNVKVYDEAQNLNQLAQKIKSQVKLDGLVWNGEVKIVPIAFGMNMLELGCVIEDEKVSIEEDVYSKILSWEQEIQSVDTVTFQKL